ncbi:4-alpha-glucanotransferase [Corynebacterium epidermidicanis]|uniref:4-alpha-glucanotransferase n=1 Tax=Corynebacterium epidermidicanis TaxID=1050174 RepID=A0A0G3GR51_9CORY|nr:4-alpha-glucanotransferase [Corynebacterium epidermidicanis]AKK03641.1 4-alpha-glucanotransferase [Corynebacterium epidermidicanis]
MSYESLKELADLHGIATSYWSAEGEYIEVSADTLLKTLHALGIDVEISGDSVTRAIKEFHDRAASRPLPPCVVSTHGYEYIVNVHVHDGAPARVTITTESGRTVDAEQRENWTPPTDVNGVRWGEASFAIPADLELGWHTLRLESNSLVATCDLVVTPERITVPEHKITGVMAQLYSVRSKGSWAMGDFHDLGELCEVVARHADADFLLINPLHAAEPFPPIEDSPYLPTTRRFINPIYIRVEDIEEITQLDSDLLADVRELATEFQELNTTSQTIERNPIYAAKLQVLREIFHLERSDARQRAFKEYCKLEGAGLDKFARWCAARELLHNPDENAHGIAPSVEETAEFYRWLQWICDQQLGAAQAKAKAAGMQLGIMADLAVGVHPGGADAEILASVLAPAASVGAPPDGYSQQGQDWSQPPWHPVKLAEAGYKPWRDMLRTVLRHSGGIRIDHVLGLFRLFWIPRMQSPTTGTYVSYDYQALIGILALEAERAGAVVIGEDLGTFEPWVQEALAARGVLGTSILWFENEADAPKSLESYRELALTSVTTHDLPPTAGYVQGSHITLRENLGVLTRDAEEEDAEDAAWQNQVFREVAKQGSFEGTSAADATFESGRYQGDFTDLLIGLHRFVAATPSLLTCAALVDMVGDIRAQNQPGTTRDMYPNWCIPLCTGEGQAVLIEDLADNELFKAVAEASKR